MKNKLLTMAVIAMCSALLTGCGAIEKFGGRGVEIASEAAELTGKAQEAADNLKAQIAEQNLDRTEDRIDFTADFGNKVDDAGLGWLDRQLQRIANFVCDLKARGIQLGPIPTRSDGVTARFNCQSSPPE